MTRLPTMPAIAQHAVVFIRMHQEPGTCLVVGITCQGDALQHSQASHKERVVWGDPELELQNEEKKMT